MTAQLSMYTASVPVFTRYLGQLEKLLILAEAHIAKHQMDPQLVLQARLAPTMLPFAVQVEVAANFAIRACAPLAGIELPAFTEHRDSFASLKQYLASTLDFVGSLTPAHMEGSESRICTSQAGLASVSLDGFAFLSQYALPNFFFHAATAFAILRHIGLDIGKSDFDGFHQYSAH
jgi:hypothetical protein